MNAMKTHENEARGRANRGGYTIIELIIVMAILSSVILVVFKLYNTQHTVANVEQGVVDLQRNLRTAAKRVSRDLRMGGFMLSSSAVTVVGNNTGLNSSDTITLSAASDTTVTAHVAADLTSVVTNGVPIAITVSSAGEALLFGAGNVVRIVDPSMQDQPVATAFVVTSVDAVTPSITLDPVTAGAVTLFKTGSLIVRTAASLPDTYPSSIQYCLGPAAGCAPSVTTCAAAPCLMRILNGVATGDSPVASNISGFQLKYLSDGSTAETDTPADFLAIRGVRVSLSGATAPVAGMPTAKARELTTIAYLRNR